MEDNNNQDPLAQAMGTQPETKPEPEVKEDIVSNIGKRLEKEETKVENPDNIKAFEPNKVDLSNLNPEQMELLKQVLAGNTDKAVKKKGNPMTGLRRYNDKMIVDFKKVFMTFEKDLVERRDKEVLYIPVKFFGDTDFTDIRYSEFQNAERVWCEIVEHKSEKKERVEGKTIHKDTNEEVDMLAYVVVDTFKVKLPSGEVVEIRGEISNG